MPEEAIEAHLATIEERRRGDVRALHALILDAAPLLAVQATSSGLGYGPYHYRYASGREGDTHLILLSARKAHLALYVNSVRGDAYLPELHAEALRGASIGRSCVRIKRLAEADPEALQALVRDAVATGGASAVST